MISQWKTFAFWIVAVLVIVLVTVLYQPAAAKTGSLLVWTQNSVYVMDIDTLTLRRVGPATAGQSITPAPGCFGQTDTPCWALIDDALYYVDLNPAGKHALQARLPADEGFSWNNGAVSWSPDGVHLAYSVTHEQSSRVELWVYNATTNEIKLKDSDVDPSLAVAWTSDCVAGLEASGCKLGYKKTFAQAEDQSSPALVGFTPATAEARRWVISSEPIFELRWSPDGTLLYSRPKRYFISAKDHTLAYHIPPGSKLANMSPDARYTVYYQPFTLAGCQSQDTDERCLHLGVWLTDQETEEERSLIYSVDLSKTGQPGGLNFIPAWSPKGDAFVFFQQGKLIYYDLEKQEGTIWYRSIRGKLRSLPVFSPNEKAVAFVDNQGQGFSEYRLVVINPWLQPVEHIIETKDKDSFRILAWLPN